MSLWPRVAYYYYETPVFDNVLLKYRTWLYEKLPCEVNLLWTSISASRLLHPLVFFTRTAARVVLCSWCVTSQHKGRVLISSSVSSEAE
jgi:hypothetical protein